MASPQRTQMTQILIDRKIKKIRKTDLREIMKTQVSPAAEGR